MRFIFEIPDEFAAKNASVPPSSPAATIGPAVYATANAISGGAAPDAGSGLAVDAAYHKTSAVSAGAAEAEPPELSTVSDQGRAVFDGGAAPSGK